MGVRAFNDPHARGSHAPTPSIYLSIYLSISTTRNVSVYDVYDMTSDKKVTKSIGL
jgi:hypothetical protein